MEEEEVGDVELGHLEVQKVDHEKKHKHHHKRKSRKDELAAEEVTGGSTGSQSSVFVSDDHSDQVTIVLHVKVKPLMREEFEKFLSSVGDDFVKFPGQLGINVVRPPRQSVEYVVILKFDSVSHLKFWRESVERKHWIEEAKPFLLGKPDIQQTTTHGLDLFFFSPGTSLTPAKWKMAMVFGMIVYTVSMILMYTVGLPLSDALQGPLQKAFPLVLQLMFMLVVIPTLTYLLAPLATKLLAFWIFKPPPKNRVGYFFHRGFECLP